MKNLGVLQDLTGPIGLAGLLVGVAVGFTLGWTTVPFVVLGLGVALIAIWVATHWPLLAQLVGLRSTQTNLNILVSIIAFTVILSVLNVFATRFDRTFDLTEEGLFSLSPQTVQVVQNLNSPLKVWVVTEDKGDAPTRQELDRYQRLNPDQFSYEFLNPRSQFSRFQELNGTRSNVFILQAGERTQEVNKPAPPEIESTLTPAILSVTGTQSITIYFTEGHGELSITPSQPGTPGLSLANRGLESEGYTISTLRLLDTDTIPDDAGAIIVAGPQTAFLQGEVERLSDYLDAGGKVLLLLNPQIEHGLDELLTNWNVTANNDVIVDQVGQQLVGDPFIAIGLGYGSHPITDELANRQVFTLFPLARSLATTETEGTTISPLVSTNPQGTWGEINLNLDSPSNLEFNPDEDNPGPLNVALALSRTLEASEPPSEETTADDSEAEISEARLVVFGNANFAADAFYGQQGNSDLLLNSINWLTEQSERISIRPKSPTNRRFQFENTGVRYVFLIAFLGLPGLAAVTGISVWWQRR